MPVMQILPRRLRCKTVLSSPTTRQAQGPSTHCVSTFFGVQNQELNVDGNEDASSSAFLEKNEFRTKPEEDKGR